MLRAPDDVVSGRGDSVSFALSREAFIEHRQDPRPSSFARGRLAIAYARVAAIADTDREERRVSCPRERYGAGRIVIYEYDPTWPVKFAEERDRLLNAVGSALVTIEHIGSTAVPGLAAKPIIDLLLGVRSLPEARRTLPGPLTDLGYRQMIEYETWLPGELLFRRGMPGPWTHHVHVVEPQTERWEECVAIRDYLRRHEDVSAAYGQLKKALAVVFDDDIAGFREGKRPFLEAVIAKARLEQDTSP
jgi:GrpB-like predicted nucleotidyltransferase (UPF0157 family)